MTVRELIEELQKIKDQYKRITIHEEEIDIIVEYASNVNIVPDFC